MPKNKRRQVKSVVLDGHDELYAWVQETLVNFSSTVVELLYALKAYQERTGKTSAALAALLADLQKGSTQAGDPAEVQSMVRDELHSFMADLERRLLSLSLAEVEPEVVDEDLLEVEMNLDSIL